MKGERTVAGLRCSEVLAGLSDYLDDELDADTRARVEEHLKGCHMCARFGGEMGQLVTALQRRLAGEPVADGVSARLRARLLAERQAG